MCLPPELAANAAHEALAKLEMDNPGAVLIVTQNVDDLHGRAGSQVLHMHGEILKGFCDACDRPRFDVTADLYPSDGCDACGRIGTLRPDVVWFGETLPLDQLEAAVEAARSCDVFFSIGTSGVVQPAASLAHAARNRGAIVVEVNAEPTSFTEKADYFLQGR